MKSRMKSRMKYRFALSRVTAANVGLPTMSVAPAHRFTRASCNQNQRSPLAVAIDPGPRIGCDCPCCRHHQIRGVCRAHPRRAPRPPPVSNPIWPIRWVDDGGSSTKDRTGRTGQRHARLGPGRPQICWCRQNPALLVVHPGTVPARGSSNCEGLATVWSVCMMCPNPYRWYHSPIDGSPSTV